MFSTTSTGYAFVDVNNTVSWISFFDTEVSNFPGYAFVFPADACQMVLFRFTCCVVVRSGFCIWVVSNIQIQIAAGVEDWVSAIVPFPSQVYEIVGFVFVDSVVVVTTVCVWIVQTVNRIASVVSLPSGSFIQPAYADQMCAFAAVSCVKMFASVRIIQTINRRRVCWSAWIENRHGPSQQCCG